MHTHNVNRKTATTTPPERWERSALETAIEEQKLLLSRLSMVWSLRLPEEIEFKEIRMLLRQLAENVVHDGVVDWFCPRPLVRWPIADSYVQGQRIAARIYGAMGVEAVAYAREELAENLKIGQWEREQECLETESAGA
ncbi:hypothetical protein CWS43_26255 [Rahnella sp. AA]|uniref:hypothetical protein n=1 Tax=Rahnella sp. AA TaxID=2057180 RepID=UPI000C337887|nr:hypothetical protein [Rahnella sp. AA]PKE27629.1 hypothetical protein CWS43_26255 [Rahnella sp. AA]